MSSTVVATEVSQVRNTLRITRFRANFASSFRSHCKPHTSSSITSVPHAQSSVSSKMKKSAGSNTNCYVLRIMMRKLLSYWIRSRRMHVTWSGISRTL